MKNTATLLLFCCLPGLQGTAKEGSYAVSTIPEALLKNAPAVVRYADAKYAITGPTYIPTQPETALLLFFIF